VIGDICFIKLDFTVNVAFLAFFVLFFSIRKKKEKEVFHLFLSKKEKDGKLGKKAKLFFLGELRKKERLGEKSHAFF
jgi:hypothetical protein